jgi:hypothetical protein
MIVNLNVREKTHHGARPAKTPHQWKDTSKIGSICYYAVNFEA